MGIQDSSVQLGDDQEWKKQLQKKQNLKQIYSSNSRQQDFYKIQNCQYPHQLIQNHLEKDKQYHHAIQNHRKCTRKHQGYNKYNICTKCQAYPQQLIPNKKHIFQRNTYKAQRHKEQNIYTKNNIYHQKQVGAAGQQTPGFYNGFSLPVEKYYRQKATISDFNQHEDIKGSIFRQKNKDLQESIYQAKSENGEHKRYYGPIQIDAQGFQQILPL